MDFPKRTRASSLPWSLFLNGPIISAFARAPSWSLGGTNITQMISPCGTLPLEADDDDTNTPFEMALR